MNKIINFKYNFVKKCQLCNNVNLVGIHSFGFHPTVNNFLKTGTDNARVDYFPMELLLCKKCELVQLNVIINSETIFPKNYAYRSGTTEILRDNFAYLRSQIDSKKLLYNEELIVDIGSNDGTLLSNFNNNYRILGVEPTGVAKIANSKGIKTLNRIFDNKTADIILKKFGKAKIITAANVFAHIADIHKVIKSILKILDKDGVFISESHYLMGLINTLQYDTIYHEHLRYYSLRSLFKLFQLYNMEIFYAERIPTHGGSIRVYASRKGKFKISNNVKKIINTEYSGKKLLIKLNDFSKNISLSKLKINQLIYSNKLRGKKIVGISAPSRSSTLINYLGLDENIIDYICEKKGSLKIGKNIPGTNIPVVLEDRIYKDQPEIALIFSWHIASDLIKIFKKNGFQGKFLIPLPKPRIID